MTMRQLGSIAAIACLCLAACGSKPKKQETARDPDEWERGKEPVAEAPRNDVGLVDAQTMEEIQKVFQRKANAVSRCLSYAVDNKELPKNSRGKVTLEVTISPAGKADDIKILKATIDSKSLNECILGRVREIQFPNVLKPTPTTYTYAFEAS
jgi:hypothetical protein